MQVVDPEKAPTDIISQGATGDILVFFFGTHDYGWVKRSNIRDFAKFQATLRKKSKKPDFVAAVKEAEEWDPNEVSAEEEAERDSGSQSLRSPSPKRRNDDKALVLTSDDEEEKDAEFVPEPSPKPKRKVSELTRTSSKSSKIDRKPSNDSDFQTTPRKPPTPPTKKPKTVELHDDVEDEAAPTQPYREEESEDSPKKPPFKERRKSGSMGDISPPRRRSLKLQPLRLTTESIITPQKTYSSSSKKIKQPKSAPPMRQLQLSPIIDKRRASLLEDSPVKSLDFSGSVRPVGDSLDEGAPTQAWVEPESSDDEQPHNPPAENEQLCAPNEEDAQRSGDTTPNNNINNNNVDGSHEEATMPYSLSASQSPPVCDTGVAEARPGNIIDLITPQRNPPRRRRVDTDELIPMKDTLKKSPGKRKTGDTPSKMPKPNDSPDEMNMSEVLDMGSIPVDTPYGGSDDARENGTDNNNGREGEYGEVSNFFAIEPPWASPARLNNTQSPKKANRFAGIAINQPSPKKPSPIGVPSGTASARHRLSPPNQQRELFEDGLESMLQVIDDRLSAKFAEIERRDADLRKFITESIDAAMARVASQLDQTREATASQIQDLGLSFNNTKGEMKKEVSQLLEKHRSDLEVHMQAITTKRIDEEKSSQFVALAEAFRGCGELFRNLGSELGSK